MEAEGKKIKVLIVEDDESLREMYKIRLEYEGFEVLVASNGEEGLAKAVSEQPDIILLDIMMPKISGFDVLDILKSTHSTAKIPVIIMTVLEQESNKVKGLMQGAEDYLIKSQTMPAEVVNKVREVLKKYNKI